MSFVFLALFAVTIDISWLIDDQTYKEICHGQSTIIIIKKKEKEREKKKVERIELGKEKKTKNVNEYCMHTIYLISNWVKLRVTGFTFLADR